MQRHQIARTLADALSGLAHTLPCSLTNISGAVADISTCTRARLLLRDRRLWRCLRRLCLPRGRDTPGQQYQR
jgi:hypothetical protein